MKCSLPAAETTASCRHHRAGRSGQSSIPKFVFVHRIMIRLLEYRSIRSTVVHFWLFIYRWHECRMAGMLSLGKSR